MYVQHLCIPQSGHHGAVDRLPTLQMPMSGSFIRLFPHKRTGTALKFLNPRLIHRTTGAGSNRERL